MTTTKEKSLSDMNSAELEAEIKAYFKAVESGNAPPDATVSAKDVDLRGEAVMKSPIDKISPADCKFLQSEIIRALKEIQ